MSGLRERQKAERRDAIRKAAIGLFENHGVQATTIEQIARVAGVSVPTVFAYFGSKQEIIFEMIRAADRQALVEGRELFASLGDPLEAFCEIARRVAEHALQMLPATIWRELLPTIISRLGEHSTGLPEAYRQLNDALVAEVVVLLSELKQAGTLRADLDVESVAYLINDYGHVQFLRLANQEPQDFTSYLADVRRFMALLFNGLLSESPLVS